MIREADFLARVAPEVAVPVHAAEQNARSLGPNIDAISAMCDRSMSRFYFGGTADGLVEQLADGTRRPQQVVIASGEAHVCLMQAALGLLATA